MFFKKKTEAGPIDWLIAGLGNPESKYDGTRHNTGFEALDALAKKLGVRVDRVRFRAYCGEADIGGQRVLLMKPQTYMNNSGEAVREAMQFYKLPPERVLVMFDDISLPVGAIRIRRHGSAGGQKGMASIIALCGSEAFPRVKIGIGAKPHPDYDLASWVLSKFTKEEKPLLLAAAAQAAEAACEIVSGDIDGAMNRHSK